MLVEDTRDQQTTYVDKDAVPGMRYRYWVQARRGSELSRASDRALTDD